MIDLSYLTEEEQEMILAVLKRDAELKKLEEQRVKQLRKTERDRSRLKYLTGEWFYETKNHRHRNRIHGSDIIRASMRQKKPVTILELSQRWSEKPSCVYGEKKDVYIPPELLGLIEDPSTESHNERVDDELPEAQRERQRPQIKPRQNPFNSVRSQRDDARLINGVKEADQTPAEETFLPAENYTLHHTTPNTDNTDTHIVTQYKPVPKKRLLLYSCKNSSLDTAISDNGVKQVMTPAPRGILKHNISSCNSTDSLHLQISTNDDSSSSQSSATVSPFSPETPNSPPLSPCSVHSASGWLDRKQVRFSSVVGPIERVQGEHSVLEEDWSPLSEQDRSNITDNGHHEVYGEPQPSQVSNFHGFTEVAGKAIGLSAEGQTDKVTVEEGHSFSKVLEWFGRGSRDGKLKESPVKKEMNEEEPKDHESPEAKSEDSVPPVLQPKTKPPPKTRDSEDDSPVNAALERANARPISVSKSLEGLASTPLQRWKTDPRSDVGLSMENVSAVTSNTKTSFSDPEQVKMMSMSVPAFMQEMDFRNSDCASVSSFPYDRLRTCNTPSNFSTCSEVASMSSVTGSVMSIYSSEFGNVEVKGTIQFAIHYVQKLGEFHVFVVQCKDLAVADVKRNRSDPYVKCYLLPDKAKYGKKKTCVRKKTLDPTFNEILRFKIPVETLKTQKLNTSVWHNDTFGRNMFLGEVELDLAEWDFSNTQMNEYLLKGRVQVPTSPKHSVGSAEMSAEIKVALRFVPQTSHSHTNKGNGEVQIWVKECKNLPITRGVAIDPFVKCAVLPDTIRKSRQKTRVLKRASNPVFNHTMVYDGFRQEDLKEACVELTVWDHDRLNNHFIGGIRLGPGTGKSYGSEVNWMDSNGAEAALWERMMQSPNEWVEDILPLRMIVMARMSR
ncbi:synaptotagmin-like protein 2 isoform X2 [Sinocyclocheilus anshuiensis]|uniref:synaptotagmin-like protein 2 isoform X2 n=1 Tax=Sinocyclocheilus anshuiensis TaxID=1608454 RepID=UPI0007B8CC08|nr:PREDICTED: synaptotagmin-like protein 2 isoform X2 [Sinocyclocheilus anshuiensis]